MSDVKRLVFAIVQFLGEELQNGGLSPDAKESLEVAVQCLETAYNINPDDPNSVAMSVPRSLLDIFSEASRPYIQNASKVYETTTTQGPVSEESKLEAEKLKNEGNNLMKAEQYKEALECYTRAISLDGMNAVYYCNRAAAYSKMNKFTEAIEDCRHAILIDSQYSKAYGRMGLAYASLNEHHRAKECYLKAVELDPQNESYQNNLKVAEEKVLEAVQNQMGSAMGAAGRGMGNPLDFSTLLSNPTLVNMATQLMQDPNMQNLGQQLAAQMQAANPDLVDQLRRQMNPPSQSQNQQNPSPDSSKQ